METITSLAVDLVLNHNIKHRAIAKAISKALKQKAEKLPKIRVLYCASHGGYGYSDEFDEYLRKNKEDYSEYFSYEERIIHVACISKFGQELIQTYPDIASMIRKYKHYNLEEVFNIIHNTTLKTKHLNMLKKNYLLAKKANDNDFLQKQQIEVIADWDLYSENLDLSKYSRELVLDTLKNTISKFEIDIKNYQEKLNTQFNSSILEKMFESFQFLYEDEIENKKLPYYSRKKWNYTENNKPILFSTAIKYYDTCLYKIWECQSYFNKNAMRFLLEYPDLLDDIHLDICESIGLLFANSEYCKLQIGEIPQLLDWTIHEYDGLESIVIL
jgi:hypothetical protein